MRIPDGYHRKVCLNGVEISSSYVRDTVKAGDMEKAEELIGGAYSVSGVVAHGKKLGRRLGMPTVNLLPEKKSFCRPTAFIFRKSFWESGLIKASPISAANLR